MITSSPYSNQLMKALHGCGEKIKILKEVWILKNDRGYFDFFSTTMQCFHKPIAVR
jgi:hypothetical protein